MTFSQDPLSVRTPATRYLDESGIPYRLFRHAGAIDSLEQAARERNQQPEQVIRSLLFRAERGEQKEYVMVLASGPDQVSWPKIRKSLGVRKLTTADVEEVDRITGYKPGTVCPFGLRAPVQILLDRRILNQSDVSLGSGERGLAILMTTDDLFRALPDHKVEDISIDIE